MGERVCSCPSAEYRGGGDKANQGVRARHECQEETRCPHNLRFCNGWGGVSIAWSPLQENSAAARSIPLPLCAFPPQARSRECCSSASRRSRKPSPWTASLAIRQAVIPAFD